MLKARLMVNAIEDLCWILRFLQRSSWLTLQLPVDTFDYTVNIDDDWIADRSTVPPTEHGAGFVLVADPYKPGPEFGSLVHCITEAWDAFIFPIIAVVGILSKAGQTSDK
jgi:23S rRNA A2030 N6-methylase RlmJ